MTIPYGSGRFLGEIKKAFGTAENVALSEVANRDGILASIKALLGLGGEG